MAEPTKLSIRIQSIEITGNSPEAFAAAMGLLGSMLQPPPLQPLQPPPPLPPVPAAARKPRRRTSPPSSA